MDFTTLGQGSPFYVLRKAEKPVLEIGIVKEKSAPHAQYPTQNPMLNTITAMNGNTKNVIDMVVTINGSDVPFSNLPVGQEFTTYNNGETFVSSSREATLKAVDDMVQASRKALELTDYHNLVLVEGEKMLESLNPRYKEEKDRDRTIKDLQERQNEQDKKLDKIISKLDDFFSTPSKSKSS